MQQGYRVTLILIAVILAGAMGGFIPTALTEPVTGKVENRYGYYSFMHERYHPSYTQLYDSGKCSCATGSCRPVQVRNTQLQATSGYDIEADGEWLPVPEESLRHKNEVPDLLGEQVAHACIPPTVQYGGDGYPMSTPQGRFVECAIINSLPTG